MKNKTIEYLLKIYCYSKKSILKLWLFDALGIIYECVEPLLLGLTIDGLIKKQYVYFICFVLVFAFNILISYFNDIDDDIVYNAIRQKFMTDHYNVTIQQEIDIGTIDAKNELIEQPIEFVRCFVVNIINIIGMLLISFTYICVAFSVWIGLFSLISCLIFTFVGIIFYKKQLPVKEQIYILEEKRRDSVGSRNNKTFGIFLRKRHELIIKCSKINANGNIFVNIVRLLIMVSTLLILSNKASVTVGQLYAGLEYIIMLISGFSLIPDFYFDYKDTRLCIERIVIDNA